MQTRKQKRTSQQTDLQKTKKYKDAPGWSSTEIIATGLILLYAITEFIPESGGGEVMGIQWVYINVLNIITTFLLLSKKDLVAVTAAAGVLRRLPSFLYFAILGLGVISLATALDRTETLVNLARLVNAIILFCNIGLLLYNRPRLFALMAQVFSLFLILQSFSTLSAFFKGLEDTDINNLILGLKGNAGNKNILAASMVIKVPFVIYCIYSFRNWKRYIHLLSLATGTFTIFILNARSSYLGLILVLALFTAAYLYLQFRQSARQVVQTLLLTILPVVLAFFLSAMVIRNAIDNQGLETPYGTVVERLNSISLTAEGSNSRIQMWSSAIEHIKKNPLMGSGYGNWKLASIPYEKTYADEFLVAYHAHNDFLELSAELGIAGGLAYFLIFVFLSLILLRKLFSPTGELNERMKAALILAALAVYFTDAFLNFPMERPVMQFYFAWILCSGLILTSSKDAIHPITARQKNKRVLPVLFLLLLLPSLYITYTTFQSFTVQKRVNQELKTGNLQMSPDEVIRSFPAIPDMNGFCYPIDIIKGIYLLEAKQYERARNFLDKGAKVNPYLPLAEFYKARILLETNKPDSAYPFAQKAFLTRPRSRSAYELMNDVCVQRKDTAALDSTFREYIKYRNEAWAWNRYIALKASLNTSAEMLTRLTDSALVLFPGDQELIQKKDLLRQSPVSASTVPPAVEEEYQKSFAAGLDLYSRQDYTGAIEHFTKAFSLKPGDYQALENTGLCFYASGNYSKAIGYFDRVLQQFAPTDGKSEYIKAICLLNLGKKEEGCLFLQKAVVKGNQQAAEQVAVYCK